MFCLRFLALEAYLDPEAIRRQSTLVYHNAAIRIGAREIAVAFDQQKQSQAESLCFKDGSSFKEIAVISRYGF